MLKLGCISWHMSLPDSGLVEVGVRLHEVGGQDVAGMSRAQILHLLQDCSSMRMQRSSIAVASRR